MSDPYNLFPKKVSTICCCSLQGSWSCPYKVLEWGVVSSLTTNAGATNVAIIRLTRQLKGSGEIDNLSYGYQGNQLLSVNDAANDNVGFTEMMAMGYEYDYDSNGNMIMDANKGFEIQYNYLNLPRQVNVYIQNISYIYTAGGTKISKVQADGSTLYYAGNFVYQGSSLKYILNEEGMVTTPSSNPVYLYSLKDHLGNTRLEVNNSGTVTQQTDYYPFGMALKIAGSSDNKYLYNGKELQDDALFFGMVTLDWYDYGARFYDPALGRWHSVDPLAEKYDSYSPYHFSGNNPILFVDGNGMDWYSYTDDDGNKHYKYQDGSDKSIKVGDNTYTNIGASVNIQLGEGYYYNAFQNYGVSSIDGPIDVKQKILGSSSLQGKLLSEGSGFSQQGQAQIMTALIHKGQNDFINHPVTQATLNGLLFVASGGIEGAASLLSAGRSLLAKAGGLAAKEGMTIVGEGMARVEAAAAKNSGSVILNNMPSFTGTADQVTSQMMQYNRQWILNQMRSGRTILDIGLDANRAQPSIFYQMEQNMMRNYLKLHPNAFQIIKP